MIEHAIEELKYLRGFNDEVDEMQDWIEKNILEIIEAFAKQGHSGSSAQYCIPIIERLLRQENITPLTGEDREWSEVADGIFQNKRLHLIFKDKKLFDGQAYTIEGKIFSDDDGKTWYTNHESKVPITFPYVLTAPEFVKKSKIISLT